MRKVPVFLIMLFAAAALAQDLPKIAVYVTGGTNADENRVLSAFMLEALIRSGKYTAVERSDDFVSQVDREQTHQRSGAVDDGQIRQAGVQAGVQYVCVVNMTQAFGAYLISARIIDVETAIVVTTSSLESRLRSLRELRNVANDVVGKMKSAAPAATATTPSAAAPTAAAPAAVAVDSAALAAVEKQASAILGDAEERVKAAEAEAAKREEQRAAAAAEAERERARADEHARASAAATKEAERERERAAAAEAKAQKAARALAEEKKKTRESSRNIIGLRAGFGNALSVDAFFNHGLGTNNRLDFATGYREYNYEFVYGTDANGNEDIDYKYYKGFELFSSFGWQFNNGEMFSFYAGPGIAVFGYEAKYYDEERDVPNMPAFTEMGVSIGAGGHAGVELNMGKLIINLDARPIFYMPLLNSGVDYASEFRFTVGVGVGYRF